MQNNLYILSKSIKKLKIDNKTNVFLLINNKIIVQFVSIVGGNNKINFMCG
jgi:hypothetical protein